MTVRKAILSTIIVPAAFLCLIVVCALLKVQLHYNFFLFTIGIILLWPVGLLVGVIISVIFKRPAKEPFFYLGGELLVIITVMCLLIVDAHKTRQHEKKFGNIEHNLSEAKFYSDYPNVDSVPIKALRKLESTFSNPNDFRIESSFCYREDTVINNFIDTLRIVTFTYMQTGQLQLLFSKITVLNNIARLDIVGEKASASTEYAKVLKKKDKLDREFRRRMKELSEQLTDSDKKAIKALEEK
jgi:hypothetical protein